METIRLTGHHKTYNDWHGDISLYLKVGDSACDELQTHFLEVMPPARWDRDLIQLGEAADHRGVSGRARFETLQKHAGKWIYTGARTPGEHVHVEATEVVAAP